MSTGRFRRTRTLRALGSREAVQIPFAAAPDGRQRKRRRRMVYLELVDYVP